MHVTQTTITIDDVFTKGDAFVTPSDRLGWTFVAANKRGRDAVQRVIDGQHPDKGAIHIEWRDAGEGWPDTWLGFDFQTPTDKPFAGAIRAQGASVFHRDKEGGFTYLPVAKLS
jgi:hypothetical protein